MKTVLLTTIAAFSFTFAASAALADSDAVQACSKDAYIQGQINENVPANERLNVLNAKNEVVGVFHFEPTDGNIHALYLCGANSGYYYAEGNAYQGAINSIYNDEYDSDVTTYEDDGKVVINIHAIYFTGEAESADYQPFAATVYIKIPTR